MSMPLSLPIPMPRHRTTSSSRQPSSLDLPPYALEGELLELAEAAPPVDAGVVAADALDEVGRLGTDVAVAVEEAEGQVEEPRMRLGRHRQQEADLVVRVDVPVERQVDLAARRRREPLRAQSVVHVVEVQALQGPDLVELG